MQFLKQKSNLMLATNLKGCEPKTHASIYAQSEHVSDEKLLRGTSFFIFFQYDWCRSKISVPLSNDTQLRGCLHIYRTARLPRRMKRKFIDGHFETASVKNNMQVRSLVLQMEKRKIEKWATNCALNLVAVYGGCEIPSAPEMQLRTFPLSTLINGKTLLNAHDAQNYDQWYRHTLCYLPFP